MLYPHVPDFDRIERDYAAFHASLIISGVVIDRTTCQEYYTDRSACVWRSTWGEYQLSSTFDRRVRVVRENTRMDWTSFKSPSENGKEFLAMKDLIRLPCEFDHFTYPFLSIFFFLIKRNDPIFSSRIHNPFLWSVIFRS